MPNISNRCCQKKSSSPSPPLPARRLTRFDQFSIGGYQPAQKWLNHRAVRRLTFEEVMHYQRIIAGLTRTAEVMAALDEVATW